MKTKTGPLANFVNVKVSSNDKTHLMKKILIVITLLTISFKSFACSILYYVDKNTGNIYVGNNEDFWYDVKPVLYIDVEENIPHLWYGWDNFAQGGVNRDGLFFDAAVTPEQGITPGYNNPTYNIGSEILANCSNVKQAIEYLEKNRIALLNSHLMFGDKTGNAVIVEWVDGKKVLHWINGNHLAMTNFLLAKPDEGNYPCPRFQIIEDEIERIEIEEKLSLSKIGNIIGKTAQIPKKINGKEIGTLYTTFIDLTNLKFIISYKLSNSNIIKLKLNEEFASSRNRKIKLQD